MILIYKMRSTVIGGWYIIEILAADFSTPPPRTHKSQVLGFNCSITKVSFNDHYYKKSLSQYPLLKVQVADSCQPPVLSNMWVLQREPPAQKHTYMVFVWSIISNLSTLSYVVIMSASTLRSLHIIEWIVRM